MLLHTEHYEGLKEARGREAEIKSWKREKKLALIQKNYKAISTTTGA
jgi:predicted GIY-YIG superfamily endonuclease